MDIQEIKDHIKALPWRSRRRIHNRCAEEAIGSWQFATCFVTGIPCLFFATIALSQLGGFLAQHNVLIASTIYGLVLSTILTRQGNRYLEKAYKEFQQ